MSREPLFLTKCVDLIISFLYDDKLHKLGGLRASLSFCVLQQQQHIGRIFGASKMHLSPAPGGLGCCSFCGSSVVSSLDNAQRDDKI